MHKDKPLKKNHCTWVIFTRIFTDTMKPNFATSFMVLPLIILPNELQEFRRKNLWKNYIKISKRSLGKKTFVLSFQSSELSIEFGTAIARTFGAIAQWGWKYFWSCIYIFILFWFHKLFSKKLSRDHLSSFKLSVF